MVVLGRYINQKIKYKQSGSNAVRKNDFSASVNSSSSKKSKIVSVNAENEEIPDSIAYYDDPLNDTYEDELTRPLISESVEIIDVEVIKFTYKSALLSAIKPFDAKEWKESNLLLKFMLLVKVTNNFLVKE